jgi:hypothetical protein
MIEPSPWLWLIEVLLAGFTNAGAMVAFLLWADVRHLMRLQVQHINRIEALERELSKDTRP